MVKKNLFVLLVMCFMGFTAAQNIDISPDFTCTDIHGTEHNLFTYLDEGKCVFLHFTGTF